MQVRNSVTLIGNVGQEPIAATLSNGSRAIEFSFATNDTYRNREGEKVTRTEWHRIKAYGKVVDVLEKYVTKGSALAITGTIRYRKWMDKFEQTRSSTEIILDQFTFLGGRDGNAYQAQQEEVEEAREGAMQAAEPAPAKKKTTKRRSKKAAAPALTPAEDLPF